MGKYPDDWDGRRREVYRRDNHTCQDCGARGGHRGDAELHAHHKVPVSKGGSHEYSNLTTLCRDCHEQVHGHRIPGGSRENRESAFKYGIHNIGDYLPTDGETGDVEAADPEELSLLEMRVAAFAVTAGIFVLLLPFWGGVVASESFVVGFLAWAFVMLILGIPIAFVALAAGAGVYVAALLLVYPLAPILPDRFYNFADMGSRGLPNDVEERRETRSLIAGSVVFLLFVTLFVRVGAPFLEATLIASVLSFSTYVIARLYYRWIRFPESTSLRSVDSDWTGNNEEEENSSPTAGPATIKCDVTDDAIKAPGEQANNQRTDDESSGWWPVG